MQELFTTLTRAVEGTPAIALAAAFIWGILSIILSPCHLASIPLIVGFIDKQGRMSTGRAFSISTLFAVGILVTIGLIGAITAAAGRMMGDVGRYGNYFVAAIFFVVGLHLLGVIPMPWSGPGQVGMKRKGLLAALILGLVFGVALGPCTFAYMAPMLGVTFKLAATNILYGVALLAGLRRGPLLGDRAGRHLHRTGAALPELERAVQGGGRRQDGLRRAGAAGRRLADLHRAVMPLATRWQKGVSSYSQNHELNKVAVSN